MFARLIRKIHRGEAGFTLIELMIVILVILILAAILVPQFSLARERARKASCVSNQRNIETAVAMWSTDNPTVTYTGGTMDGSTPGKGALAPAAAGPQYTLSGAFAEPDDTATPPTITGVMYYLSQGSAAGGTPAPASPSYGHVACANDKIADGWVANYDGVLGSIVNINHARGSAASP